MAGDDSGDKTELPTEHRRTESRQKGNVARSQDLSSAGMMLAVALGLSLFILPLLNAMQRLMAASLRNARPSGLDTVVTVALCRKVVRYSLIEAAPFLLLLVAAAVLVNVVQVGFLLTPEALTPKFSRVNPIEGVKRLFSMRAVIRLFGSLAKLAVVVAIAGLFIQSIMPFFLQLGGAEPAALQKILHSHLVQLAFQLALALFALALLDFAFQKWKHEQDLHMTKQEVREEMKQMEGDPHIRQRRREAHRKLAQAREMNQVKDADVVITNPTHIAVALKYDPETMPAPLVLAKGMGEIAEQIRRIAIEHRVPIIERKELARSLYRTVKAGGPIPSEMYEVFVEIMAYVYRITGRTPQGLRNEGEPGGVSPRRITD